MGKIIKVLRFAAIAAGALLALGGILGITSFNAATMQFLQVIVSVYMIFGGLIVCAEFQVEKVVEQFNFLKHYPGRGAYYIFCGSLCFGRIASPLIFVIGVILIINGVLNIAFAIKYDMLGLDVASVESAAVTETTSTYG